ncbi:MAG: TerC/Alx family metal homeostasis membrane protein [Lachnospiraceae bacterium]|nr:TerC/Alx family metal homeostasis membrane protein [Lachnospiraceae bacterium]
MWIWIALLIDFILFLGMGQETALDFLGGYLIELSLSIDNLFVFLSIFSSFSVPERLRHRVLRYGLIGAALLRMVFILLGSAVISEFRWILYFFGIILIGNGVKMLGERSKERESAGIVLGMKAVRKFLPLTEDFCDSRFFVKREAADGKKRWYATPLFAVLVVVEISDIIFAIDSVPAVLSVTTNSLIVYTSNLLAVMGLRQLYFSLEKLEKQFVCLKYGIAAVLMFTGLKMLAELFSRSVSTASSIIFILSAMLISMAGSLLITKKRSE